MGQDKLLGIEFCAIILPPNNKGDVRLVAQAIDNNKDVL